MDHNYNKISLHVQKSGNIIHCGVDNFATFQRQKSVLREEEEKRFHSYKINLGVERMKKNAHEKGEIAHCALQLMKLANIWLNEWENYNDSLS